MNASTLVLILGCLVVTYIILSELKRVPGKLKNSFWFLVLAFIIGTLITAIEKQEEKEIFR
jgi:hypothetical protein